MPEIADETMKDARARDNVASSLSPPRTEGQRALRLQPGSLSSIAAKIGVDKGTVSRWRSGEKIPDSARRARLHSLFGIAPEAWDRGPLGAEPTPVAMSAIETDRPSTSREITEARLNRLHKALELNPSLPDYIKIESQIGDAAKELRMIESAAEMMEARIVREHPRWREIVRGLPDVLRPYPQAAEAVAAFLAGFEDA